jgi:hypothetical protein
MLIGTSGQGVMRPQVFGIVLFDQLVGASFLLCCLAGALTVDGISRERREGTLGLLFLTRVGVVDVLLGKFGAAGISGVCMLAAFAPMLVIPLLAGGVTAGEAARQALALFDTMILSLAAGLWASAGEREWRACVRSAARLLALIFLVPPLLGRLVSPPLGVEFSWLGPFNAFVAGGDVPYRQSALPYWVSILAAQGIACLLVLGAGARMRRAMRDGDETVKGRTEEDPATHGFMLASHEFKPRPRMPSLAGEAPLEWLMRREAGGKAVVWTATILAVVYYFAGYSMWNRIGGLGATLFTFSAYWSCTGFAVSLALGCLFGWLASRYFIEARQSGQLELLLTTPEGARTLVASHWKWLKALFLKPAIFLVLVQLLPSLSSLLMDLKTRYYGENGTYFLIWMSLSMLCSLASIVAVLWCGMWFGWSERLQSRAILRVVLAATVAPYVMRLIVALVVRSLFSIDSRSGFYPDDLWNVLAHSTPSIVVLGYYVWLIRWAWRRLRAETACQ